MKYKEFCEQIIELVGGKNNIEAVVHCMTRLRFTLKDRNKAKTEDIKALKDVIDVVSNEVAYQIIIGTQVAQIHEELLQLLGMETSVEKKVKKNPVKAVLDVLSECMNPILEPMMAAGIIAGLLSIVSLLRKVLPTSFMIHLDKLFSISCLFIWQWLSQKDYMQVLIWQ